MDAVLVVLWWILFVAVVVPGVIFWCLVIGARLGLWGLAITIIRDPGHDHDDEGNCIPTEAKVRKAETPVQWKPDGSHERID